MVQAVQNSQQSAVLHSRNGAFENFRLASNFGAETRHVSANQVVKVTNNNVSLQHKAYNGRVLCAYFTEVAALARSKQLVPAGPQRIFGEWLRGQSNGADKLSDTRLPLQAACMLHGLTVCCVVFELFCKQHVWRRCTLQGRTCTDGSPLWNKPVGTCALGV